MTIADWVTITAILLGPISAVLITRWIDNRRQRDERRFEVFRTLMRTRRTPQAPEHVGALNLIEIEFSKDDDVIRAWKALFEHFGGSHVRRSEEELTTGLSSEEVAKRNEQFGFRLMQERNVLLATLLSKMASVLKFKAEQLEIFSGGYTPQGWGNIESEQQFIRRFLLDLYQGRAVLPVWLANQSNGQREDE